MGYLWAGRLKISQQKLFLLLTYKAKWEPIITFFFQELKTLVFCPKNVFWAFFVLNQDTILGRNQIVKK